MRTSSSTFSMSVGTAFPKWALAVILLFAVALPLRTSVAQCGGGAQKGDVTHVGTDFLLCFEQNDQPGLFLNDSSYLEISMAATVADAIVSISCKQYPTYHRTFSIPAGGTKIYRISGDTIQYHNVPRQLDTIYNLWITSSEVTDQRVVMVTSTAPIICYGMNRKAQTTDAFIAYPKQTALMDYRIMSYPSSVYAGGSSPTPSEFAVAAFEDNTTVTIVPSGVTGSGTAAGLPILKRLNRGECVQIQSATDPLVVDFTGSHVSSDKPVAVYGANARTEVPHDYLRNSGTRSRDHVCEAMPPVATWGKRFVLSSLQMDSQGGRRIEGDLMRVLALDDNTEVTVNGKPWGLPLAHDQWRDSLINTNILIESTKPILVGEYAHCATDSITEGDPFLAIVPSVDQTYNDFTFFMSQDPAFTVQKVIIAADLSAIQGSQRDSSTIHFDGGGVLPSFIFDTLPKAADGKTYVIAQVGVDPGVHSLQTSLPAEKGFSILAFGLGEVDSYGYTAGSLLKPLRSMMVEQQPTVPIRGHENEITIRNATNETLYLDGMNYTLDDHAGLKHSMHLETDLRDVVGLLMPCESTTMKMISDDDAQVPMTGVMHLYSHNWSWHDFETQDIPFTVYPKKMLGVGGAAEGATKIVTNYPNPFNMKTQFAFTLTERADISIKVIDALGRTMRVIADGEFAAGPYNITMERGDLAAGAYFYEVRSEKLGLSERHTMLIGK